jgi:hypothetical protein
VGRVWFAANASYWTPVSTFEEGCQGVLDAGRALGVSKQELEALRTSFADVGVVCDAQPVGCSALDGVCKAEGGETPITCPEDCGKPGEKCSIFERAKCDLAFLNIECTCTMPGPGGCGDGLCSESENDQNCGQDCGCSFPGACDSVAPFGCHCDGACTAKGDCCADVGVCQ